MQCLLSFMHSWAYVFSEGPKMVRKCRKCGRVESTAYDMAYGSTYWVPGNSWAPFNVHTMKL